MPYTFDGIPYGVSIGGDGLVPRIQNSVKINEEPIPYTDDEVIDYGGMNLRRVRCRIQVLNAHVANFENRLGKSKVLQFNTITMNARLIELNNPMMNFDQTHYWFEAYWVEST